MFKDLQELKKYLFYTTVILARVAVGCERGKNEKISKCMMAIALANYLMATPS